MSATIPDDTSLDKFDLSFRTHRVLTKVLGLKTLGEVRRMTEAELLRQSNFGRMSLREVIQVLGPIGCNAVRQRMLQALVEIRTRLDELEREINNQ